MNGVDRFHVDVKSQCVANRWKLVGTSNKTPVTNPEDKITTIGEKKERSIIE